VAKHVQTTFAVASMVTVGQLMTIAYLPTTVRAIVSLAAAAAAVVVRAPLMSEQRTTSTNLSRMAGT
jgi:hypothetical protein